MAIIRWPHYISWLFLLLSIFLFAACGPETSAQSASITLSQSELTTRANTEPILREPTATPVRVATESPRATETWALVLTGPLNLRSGPGMEYKVEGMLNTGECLAVQASSGTWSQLRSSAGKSGWSHSDYLEIVNECPASIASVTAQQVANVAESWGIVTADLLNMRAGPDGNHSVVGQLANGACVEVLDAQGTWLNVRHNSITGWSSSDYIRLADACPAIAVQPVAVQPIREESVAPAPVQPAVNTNSVFRVNAATTADTHIHECFGGGDSELRFVPADTPIQVLGVGDWIAPIIQYSAVGEPPYLKIRIWDGQYAWIAATATNVDPNTQPVVPGVCEAYERLNWEVIEQARPTATATATARPTTPPVVMSTPVPVRSCCRICTTGKACGNSCISRRYTCRVGPGCACNG